MLKPHIEPRSIVRAVPAGLTTREVSVLTATGTTYYYTSTGHFSRDSVVSHLRI